MNLEWGHSTTNCMTGIRDGEARRYMESYFAPKIENIAPISGLRHSSITAPRVVLKSYLDRPEMVDASGSRWYTAGKYQERFARDHKGLINSSRTAGFDTAAAANSVQADGTLHE